MLYFVHTYMQKNKMIYKTNCRPRPEQVLTEEIPWGIFAAVSVDAAVDGILIGLAYVASSVAGLSMTIATCIEMGFFR